MKAGGDGRLAVGGGGVERLKKGRWRKGGGMKEIQPLVFLRESS